MIVVFVLKVNQYNKSNKTRTSIVIGILNLVLINYKVYNIIIDNGDQ